MELFDSSHSYIHTFRAQQFIKIIPAFRVSPFCFSRTFLILKTNNCFANSFCDLCKALRTAWHWYCATLCAVMSKEKYSYRFFFSMRHVLKVFYEFPEIFTISSMDIVMRRFYLVKDFICCERNSKCQRSNESIVHIELKIILPSKTTYIRGLIDKKSLYNEIATKLHHKQTKNFLHEQIERLAKYISRWLKNMLKNKHVISKGNKFTSIWYLFQHHILPILLQINKDLTQSFLISYIYIFFSIFSWIA